MSKRGRRGIAGLKWMVAGTGALLLSAIAADGAHAQTAFDTLARTFRLHGYVENQTIERSDTYVRDWHNASTRSRLDVQVSGTIARHLDLPLMPGVSAEYFLELRPGYEAAYDIDRDRFGNATTGFSGGAPGFSPFSRVPGLPLASLVSLLGTSPPFGLRGIPPFNPTGIGYSLKQFMMQGPKDFAPPMPIDPGIQYLPRPEGACKHCQNVTVPLSMLRFEIDDNNSHYYPVREGYFDLRWFWHGQNWLRLGKQQIVWGKADFFRLQDIVNNIDLAQHYNVEPFEDTRTPNWSASLQHRFGDVGPMRDVALTGVWNFDTFIPVGLGQGGQPWATHFGQALRSFSFIGDVFEHVYNPGLPIMPCFPFCSPTTGAVGQVAKFALHEFKMPDHTFKNMGYGAKLDWAIKEPMIRFSLTDYIGEGDPVFRYSAVNLIGAFVPPQVAACLAAKGVKTVLTALGPTILVNHPNQTLPSCINGPLSPIKGMPNYVFANSYGADGNLIVAFHKHNTLGLSADYFDPASGLVIRAESSWSHNVLINDSTSFDWTANNDVLQWVVGADRQFFVRAINPDRTFFGSMQVFAHYMPGASSIGRRGAAQRLSSYIFTAFLQTHYYRDQIIPMVFAAYDTLGTDGEIGGNVEWLIDDHWSAQIGTTAFLGKANVFDATWDAAIHPGCTGAPCTANQRNYTEQAFGLVQEPLGAFRNVYDEVWTRLRYRF